MDLRIAAPLPECRGGAFVTTRLAKFIPDQVTLSLLGAFAAVAAVTLMLQDSFGRGTAKDSLGQEKEPGTARHASRRVLLS